MGKDSGGSRLVDPEGAELTPTDHGVWYDDSERPIDLRPERSAVRPQGWPWDGPFGSGSLLSAVISAKFGARRYRLSAAAAGCIVLEAIPSVGP